MTFDIVVMQGHGQITDRHRYCIEGLRDKQPACGLIDDAALILRTHLSPDPAHCGSFHAPMAPSRGYVLHWRQPQPTSALAAILMDDMPSLLSLLLFGGEPVTDAIAVKAMSETMASWAECRTPALTRAFATIRQRPVVVTFPFLRQTTEQQTRFLTILTVCLASAFFERAAAFIAKVDALCKRVGGSKPRESSEHLWN
jgi:hypothetical protein